MTTPEQLVLDCATYPVGAGPVAVAVDVGGTHVKAGLVDRAGRITDALTCPAPIDAAGSGPGVVTVAERLVADFAHRSEAPIERIALVAPGVVDDEQGVGVWSANLHWRDFPFARELHRRTGLPARMSHDVRAAGDAEFTFGHRSVSGVAAMITLGTGIAAALRIDGRMHSGGGWAGEIGFVEVMVGSGTEAELVPLETVASAASIARRYEAATGRHVPGSKAVVERMLAGDVAARAAWGDAVDALAQACVGLVTVLGCELVVFGGGLCDAVGLHEQVAENLDRRLSFQRRPRIERAVLGPAAGLIGAAMQTRLAPQVG